MEKKLINRFSINVIGEYDMLSESEKSYLDMKLQNFVHDFNDIFSEGILTADIIYKKGLHNHGKYRGVPLIYLKVRFSTDKGLFVVSKENWGIQAALHDSLKVLSSMIWDEIKVERKGNIEKEIFSVEA